MTLKVDDIKRKTEQIQERATFHICLNSNHNSLCFELTKNVFHLRVSSNSSYMNRKFLHTLNIIFLTLRGKPMTRQK